MPAGEGIAQRFQDVTTYQTNAAGQTWATTYSDGATPAITNYLDRLGRVTNIIDGAGIRFLTYDVAGRLVMETNFSGALAGVALIHPMTGWDAAPT